MSDGIALTPTLSRRTGRGGRSAGAVARANYAGRAARGVGAILVGLIVCLSGGCAVIGLIADKSAGGQMLDAQYKLPQEPTVVLIENYHNPDAVGLVADRLSHDVTEELKRNKLAPMIEYSTVEAFRTAHPDDFHHLDTAALARKLGAKQIVYGHLTQYGFDSVEGSGSAKGHAKLFVRVIDATSGETRFPTDSGPGELIDTSTPTVQLRDGETVGTIEDGLITKMAIKVSYLFMKHPSEEPADEMKN